MSRPDTFVVSARRLEVFSRLGWPFCTLRLKSTSILLNLELMLDDVQDLWLLKSALDPRHPKTPGSVPPDQQYDFPDVPWLDPHGHDR